MITAKPSSNLFLSDSTVTYERSMIFVIGLHQNGERYIEFLGKYLMELLFKGQNDGDTLLWPLTTTLSFLCAVCTHDICKFLSCHLNLIGSFCLIPSRSLIINIVTLSCIHLFLLLRLCKFLSLIQKLCLISEERVLWPRS
jgi:hypothetical protein